MRARRLLVEYPVRAECFLTRCSDLKRHANTSTLQRAGLLRYPMPVAGSESDMMRVDV